MQRESFNIIGKTASQNQTKIKIQPVWEIDVDYPMGISETTKTYKLKIDTSKFQNEDEIKKFIIKEISDD